MDRVRTAARLAMVTALWCWLLTALHGIWSFGIVLDYLDGGRIPLYPTWPVTYASFFSHTFGAFAVTFVLSLMLCYALPHRFHLIALIITWLVGAWWGASDVSFVYQIEFGATWGRGEAVRGLFYHPVVTPFWLLFGLAGTASLTRLLRRPN